MANKNLTKGFNFVFTVDGSIVGGQQKVDLKWDGEVKETTSSEDGEWKSFQPCGGKGFTANLDAFFLKDTDSSRGLSFFMNCFLTNASIGFKFQNTDASYGDYYTGVAYVGPPSMSNVGANTEFVAYSIPITATGPVAQVAG